MTPTNGNGTNGHAEITIDDVLAALDYYGSKIAELKDQLKAKKAHCPRCQRVLSGASRGGQARAESCREDPRRLNAKEMVEQLREQFPRLSLSRCFDLVGKEFGVSGSTVRRWAK